MATLWGRRTGTMWLGALLLPLLVLGVAGSRLQVFTDPSSRALLGSGALLKCRFDVGGPVDLSSLRVQWYLWEERIAQYDQGRGESQVRASMSQQELENGNASLSLSSVMVSDEGPYKCVIGYGTEQLQGETTLRVFAAPRLSIPRRAAGTDTATSFPCHVWGFYPGDVTVTWLRDGRVLTDATRSAPQRNPDGTFNLTLTHTFTPSASDSSSIFSCHVSHAALAQPLREEFPLDVTLPRAGADHTSAAIGATLGILVAGGAAAALAMYCRRKRRRQEGPSSAVETPPEDPAGSRDRTRGEDMVLMGNDGVSDAREGSEEQPLLPAQGQGQSETQEQDGAQGTASSNSSGSKASDVDTRASSCIMQGGPEAEGPSPNTEPLGETGGLDEERVGAASPQAQPVAEVAFPAQPSTAGERGETDLNQHSQEAMVPTSQTNAEDQGAPSSQTTAAADTVPDPAQEEDAEGEAGGNIPQAPVLGEISQPEVLIPGEPVTLSCQISGFYPKELSVTWYRQKRGEMEFRCLDNLDTHKIDTPDLTAAADGKSYSVTSQLSFTPVVPEDDGAEYLCSVEHQTLQEPEGKSTGPLELRVPQAPVLGEISWPQVLTHGEKVTLSCQISGFYPKELSVTWLRRGRGAGAAVPLQGSAEYRIDPGAPRTQDGKSFQQETRLSFTPSVQRDQGAEYICRVGHVALQTPLERRSRELRVEAQPQVSEIQVLPHWEPRDKVPFAVQIQNFYPTGIHQIEWDCDGTQRWRDETPEINQNPDLTFSATSVWRIPSKKLNRPELRVRVSVQQRPRELAMKREIRARDTGVLRPPEVSEISQLESVMAGEEITLSCRMAGHFPGELSVTWLRRGIGARAAVPLQGSAEYRIEPGAPHTQDGKSFQQETRLSFTPLVQRDQWAEYICRVGHVALQTPLERCIRKLQMTGCADSAETKSSASENRGQEEEPASSPGAAAVTSPLVEEGAGEMAPKGNAEGDSGAETNSESDTRRDTTMTQKDTATPAKGGATSDTSAEEQAGDNTTDVGTTSDVPTKEHAGGNTADEDTTTKLAEGFPGGARPAIGVVGHRVASTTPVTKVAADAMVGAPPAGGPDPEAEASATRGGDDADRAKRVEEPGADGTADASPGNSEQTA